MTLSWAKTSVPVKVEVDFADKLFAQIEEVMASDAKKNHTSNQLSFIAITIMSWPKPLSGLMQR
jgi:hypothetical protein